MLLLWHCLTAALPTVNPLLVSMDRARQKQQAGILEKEGILSPSKLEHWQVRSMEGICYTDKK